MAPLRLVVGSRKPSRCIEVKRIRTLDLDGTNVPIAFSKCRSAARRDMERQNCPNRDLEDPRSRDGEWCASSILMVTGKPISPVTAGSSAPFLFIRWTPITTGNAFSDVMTLSSVSSEKTSLLRGFLITRSASAIDTALAVRIFEVTQPRVTCYRVGIRMNEPRMAALLVAHHRPGFYFRVLQEGEVGAGDDIVKIADGPERISVADIDALLYLPGHSSEQLQRALRIPALSKGWQSSFQAMLQQDLSSKTTVGNPGLANEEQAPAWPGFRQMRVADIHKESDNVTSFVLSPIDGQPLPVFQAGQFVVLRLLVDPGKPPVLRSYSLSDLPAADHFRISVKSELNGIGSSFLCNRAQEGDVLDVSAPRGNFTLRPSQSPVVLLSAGVGATPCDVDAAHTRRRKIATRDLVDLWSAQ